MRSCPSAERCQPRRSTIGRSQNWQPTSESPASSRQSPILRRVQALRRSAGTRSHPASATPAPASGPAGQRTENRSHPEAISKFVLEKRKCCNGVTGKAAARSHLLSAAATGGGQVICKNTRVGLGPAETVTRVGPSLLHTKRYFTPSDMAVSRQHLPPYRVFTGAQMSEMCGQGVRGALVLDRHRLGLPIESA